MAPAIVQERFSFLRSVRLQPDTHGPPEGGHYRQLKNALAERQQRRYAFAGFATRFGARTDDAAAKASASVEPSTGRP